MSIRPQTQVEPIPGYRLIERIGGGGFGEVWKAEAPGGLLKAIKFVHGTLHGNHSEDGLVHQELKALGRVKTVRHPYILSLERYDIIDGQLLIVMELADRNLWDRFTECRAARLPGIPREELLRYLEETAEALDLMNIHYQLQHLDIKPQNLFLVHNHIKVADFGLVKALEGISTAVSGGVTPVYAAPETFEGSVSRYCDQYSLAIVYQELLTGERPFNGANVRQLLMQHVTGTPNLASLPENDRGTIARALSKKPDDRFRSCAELVQALRQGSGAARSNQALDHTPGIVETPPAVRLSPTRVSERPPPGTTTIPPSMVPSRTFSKSSLAAVLGRKAEAIAPREEVTGAGVLFPALVIGLGGLGVQVLRQLRGDLRGHCGGPDLLPQLRLLAVDTDPQLTSAAKEGPPASALEESEVLLARLNKPAHYLKTVQNRAMLDSWLNLAMVCRLPRNQVTAEGMRILGRLGLVDNYRAISARLRADLEACIDPKALTTADRQTGLGIRTNRPRVYIVTGLGGGTGGGMFIDLAYMVREQLRRLGFAEPDVAGLFLLPPADPAAKKSPALVNAFAALTELNHFSLPDVRYQAFFDSSDEPLHDDGSPFSRCIVLPLPRDASDPAASRAATAQSGDWLCRQLIHPLARKVDQLRAERSEPATSPALICQTFGSQRLVVPRRVLQEQAAGLLGLRIVQGWTSPDRHTVPQAIAARLANPSTGIDLGSESLMGRLKSACERGLQQAPENQFQAIVQRCFGPGGDVQPAAVLGALGQLEELVGRPAGDSGANLLGDGLAQAGQILRRELGQRLADLLAGLVEAPKFRVGGAEEAHQQIVTAIREMGQAQQARHRELQAKAADAHTHIHALVCNLQKSSWWPGRKSKVAGELRQALEAFPAMCYQARLLENLLALYRGLLEDLAAKQQELTFARERLGQFERLLREEVTAPGISEADMVPGRLLFPGGARSFAEAVDALLKSVKLDALIEIDQKAQPLIRRQLRSLLQVCLGPPAALEDLWNILEQQARNATAELIGQTSIAAIYLKDNPDEDRIATELNAAFDEASPPLSGPRPAAPEIRLLAVPTDRAGERLGQLAQGAVDGMLVLPVAGIDDICFYREQPRLPLADLPQLGLVAEQAYRQAMSQPYFTPHTRIDVTRWRVVE